MQLPMPPTYRVHADITTHSTARFIGNPAGLPSVFFFSFFLSFFFAIYMCITMRSMFVTTFFKQEYNVGMCLQVICICLTDV